MLGKSSWYSTDVSGKWQTHFGLYKKCNFCSACSRIAIESHWCAAKFPRSGAGRGYIPRGSRGYGVYVTVTGSYSLKENRVNFYSICHWRHSLGSDVSDHFFWSEYRVNWTRFHSLGSSEFFTLLKLESSEIYSSTNEISSLHRWSELFTRFFLIEYVAL